MATELDRLGALRYALFDIQSWNAPPSDLHEEHEGLLDFLDDFIHTVEERSGYPEDIFIDYGEDHLPLGVLKELLKRYDVNIVRTDRKLIWDVE